MHSNSLEAHNRNKLKLNKREELILGVYRKQHPTPLSDRFVAQLLCFDDMNMCRPRITSLIRKSLLVQTGKKYCLHTKMRVRHCRLATEFPQLQMHLGV